MNGVVGHNEAAAAANPFDRMRSLEQELSVELIGGWLREDLSKEQASNNFVLKECQAPGHPLVLCQCTSMLEINLYNCSEFSHLPILHHDN